MGYYLRFAHSADNTQLFQRNFSSLLPYLWCHLFDQDSTSCSVVRFGRWHLARCFCFWIKWPIIWYGDGRMWWASKQRDGRVLGDNPFGGISPSWRVTFNDSVKNGCDAYWSGWEPEVTRVHWDGHRSAAAAVSPSNPIWMRSRSAAAEHVAGHIASSNGLFHWLVFGLRPSDDTRGLNEQCWRHHHIAYIHCWSHKEQVRLQADISTVRSEYVCRLSECLVAHSVTPWIHSSMNTVHSDSLCLQSTLGSSSADVLGIRQWTHAPQEHLLIGYTSPLTHHNQCYHIGLTFKRKLFHLSLTSFAFKNTNNHQMVWSKLDSENAG